MSAALEVLQPSTVVHCAHYSCKLTARACVLRQTRVINSCYGKPLLTERLSSFCRTGDCAQGKGVAAQLAGVVLDPPRKPSCFVPRPRLEVLPPAPRRPRKVRIAPELPPAIAEEIGEDLDEACAPPPAPELEERRAAIAEAVLARQAEKAAVRPPPPRSQCPKVSAGARVDGAGEIRSGSCAGRSASTSRRASSAPCRRC